MNALLSVYRRWPLGLVTAAHLALLALFLWFAFGQNLGNLFRGLDGLTMISLADEQLTYFGVSPNLHSNVLEGLGNLSIASNLSVIPAFWFKIVGEGFYTPQAAYVFFAIATFATVMLAGWSYGFPPAVRLAAAWLFTLLFLPTIQNFNIYPITFLVPHTAFSLLLVVITDVAIRQMGGGGWARTAGYTLLLLASVLAQVITNPTAFMIFFPYFVAAILCSLALATNHERVRKIVAGLAALAIMAAFGWVEYVLGLMLNTAYGFFAPEIEQSPPPLLYLGSILFEGHSWDGYMGPSLFLGSAAGAAMLFRAGTRMLRYAAATVLVSQALIAVIGYLSMTSLIPWKLPSPVYFEFAFFPLYTLFATYFLARAGGFCLRFSKPLAVRAEALARLPGASVIVAVPVLAVIAVFLLLKPGNLVRENDYVWPAATPATELLQREIGVEPGSPFRGKVLSFIPGQDFYKQMDYFFQSNVAFRNEHQAAGLWLYHIPTLHEYNQIITPGYFWLIRNFLSEPGTIQIRNWTTFTRVNPPILKLLGVRFFLSPSAIPGTKQRLVLPPMPKGDPLQLLEWQGANVDGISARKIAVADTLDATAALMQAPNFSTATAIVSADDQQRIGMKLVAAKQSDIAIEKGGYRIRASSNGRSLLILPLEYSSCLDIKTLSGKPPQAVRTDGVLTGLLFEREVDALLAIKTGPFSKPRCRLQDYQTFKRLMQPPASSAPAAPAR